MCARVGNQRSHGVVTARVRTNAVWSLRHQHRDLHQSTYPYLSEDRDSSYYQEHPTDRPPLPAQASAMAPGQSCSGLNFVPILNLQKILIH
jgi:hypothetical protein